MNRHTQSNFCLDNSVKGIMRLTLFEEPIRKTRPDQTTVYVFEAQRVN